MGDVVFMKAKITKTIILIMMSICITGCSKANYQKDESYETDIVGTYDMQGFSTETNELILQYQYKFDNDKTFEYYGLLSNTECIQQGDFIVESITDEISKIDFNIKDTKIKPDKDSAGANSARMSSQMFKYKNMLGYIYETDELPTSSISKTFNCVIYYNDEKISGLVFTEDGYTHACSNVINCQCDYAKNVQYIIKDDIIYWYSTDLSNKDFWTIGYYITDIGLFQPFAYKIKE